MVNEYKYRDIKWLDLESPDESEISAIKDKFKIHPLVSEELKIPSFRAKVDMYNNHIYMILHFPIYHSSTKSIVNREIDFIIGKKFLITTHYQDISPLHETAKIFKYESILENGKTKIHTGFLFFYIIKHLYNSLEGELDIINKELTSVEEDIFSGKEHDMVLSLSIISKLILDFRRSVKSHREVLSSFEVAGLKLFGADFSYYLSGTSGEFQKIWNLAESAREDLQELRETNDSILNTRINDIMKFLTIMAFVTFPLSLIAGIFGMNTVYLPLIGDKNDFWIILGIMITITLLFFSFFKYKKWL